LHRIKLTINPKEKKKSQLSVFSAINNKKLSCFPREAWESYSLAWIQLITSENEENGDGPLFQEFINARVYNG